VTEEKKGLVVDVDIKKAILLTSSGEFISVKLPNKGPIPSIGEEYSFKYSDIPSSSYSKFIKYAALVAIFLVCFVLTSVKPLTTESLILPQMESYLIVDINPSVELGLDKNEYVRTATALNKDGEHVLQNNDLIGKPLKVALKQLIDKAIELGYLNTEVESQNILLTYVPTKAEASTKVDSSELVEEVEKSLVEKNITANVDTITTDENVRKEANDLGISTGKYVIFRKALENGLDITPEELQVESLGKAVKKSGGDLRQLLKQAKKEQVTQRKKEKIAEKLKEKIEKEKTIGFKINKDFRDNIDIKTKVVNNIDNLKFDNNQKDRLETSRTEKKKQSNEQKNKNNKTKKKSNKAKDTSYKADDKNIKARSKSKANKKSVKARIKNTNTTNKSIKIIRNK
jgi:hypothetical protein